MAVTDIAKHLQVGKFFPPATELERLKNYKRYKDIFDGNIVDACPDIVADIGKIVKVGKDGATEAIEVNPYALKFARLIVKKMCDLMFGKPPTVNDTSNKNNDDKIKDILINTDTWNMLSTCQIDCLVYGNGVIKTYAKDDVYSQNEDSYKSVGLSPTQPKFWFVEVNPRNQYDIKSHIIGWVYSKSDDDNNNLFDAMSTLNQDQRLYVEVHRKGSYDTYEFKVSGPVNDRYELQELVEQTVNNPTGLKNNAVQIFRGFSTSEEGLLGESMMDMIIEPLKNIIVRLTQINSVLDKHVMPTLVGPAEIAEKDEGTGRRYLKLGKFIGIPNSTPAGSLQYLTWDGKLDSAFEMVDKSVGYLYQLAETGAPMLDGDTDKLGFAESARALYLRHKSPISASQAWLTRNRLSILATIDNILQIGGLPDVKWNNLSFSFNMNLPTDTFQLAQEFNARVTSKTESVVEGLIKNYGLSRAAAENVFKQIVDETKQLSEIHKDENNSFGNQKNILDGIDSGQLSKSEDHNGKVTIPNKKQGESNSDK